MTGNVELPLWFCNKKHSAGTGFCLSLIKMSQRKPIRDRSLFIAGGGPKNMRGAISIIEFSKRGAR